MPLTADASALTEQHRQAQVQLQRHTLRDFLLLWPLWNGDSSSFASLVQATQPLVQTYRSISAQLAGSFYTAFRTVEGIEGDPTVKLAAALPSEQVAASLRATGEAAVNQALSAGRPAEEARQAALVRASGAVTRHVLNGGRETILQSARADNRALGWARVTDGDPCAFCAMLAGRGAVYFDSTTADFQAHDHCGCQALPVYKAGQVPALNRRFADLYDRSQQDAEASGELKRGENSDRIRVFRRAYDEHRAATAA